MWSIKKIFHYDTKTGNSYVLLNRNSKPTKNKNSDLIRVWYSRNFPDKKDTPDVLKDKKLGRLTYWLGGKTESKAFEEAIINDPVFITLGLKTNLIVCFPFGTSIPLSR